MYTSHKSFNDTLIKEIPQDIETLYVWNNQIRSFEHSENLPRKLKILILDNQISSFKHSEELPRNLEKLYLYDNQISSFKHSEELPRNLKELYLYGNKISSFEHSEGLPRNLEILYLIDNPIGSFEHSENLPRNLKTLIINKNQIKYPQKILRYAQFKFETSLETIKFLQHYQCFKYILNEIKYNPHLERTKSKLKEKDKQIKKDPESFYKSIF